MDSAQLFSFVATENCEVLCGLKIDFLDIDPDTWNISIEKLEKKLKIAKIKALLFNLASKICVREFKGTAG